MIKTYRKTATIKAEQFDGSDEMIEKYHIRTNTVYELDPECRSFDYIVPYQIQTLEGFIELDLGDWIVTVLNGEHWAIADDIFKKTYVEAGNDKKIVKAVQFDSFNEEMMSENEIYEYDYGIYLIDINGLRVFLSQGDWIVTYQNGNKFVIPDEDWKGEK